MSSQDAELYASSVVPRFSSLFGRRLIPQIPEGQRLQVLDVGCGTGYPALEVMARLGDGGRVIAIDPDPALIDVARRRALDEAGRRIFFKPGSAESLGFGDEVFDVVMGNLVLDALGEPEAALSEMLRVLVPGGRMVLTMALESTFEEVMDMFREVGLKRDDLALAQRIEHIGGRYPTASRLEAMVKGAGFESVTVHRETLHLRFDDASHIFTDPAMRFVALPEWRWIAGFDRGSARTLTEVQESLDTYFGGGPLSLRIEAGLVVAEAA